MVATPAGGLRILVGGVQPTGCLLATSSAWRPHGPELVASLGVGRRLRSFCETGEGYSDLFRQARCRTIGAPVRIPATATPQVLGQKVRVGCRQLANRNSDRRPEICPILRWIVRQNASTRSVLCAGLGRGYLHADLVSRTIALRKICRERRRPALSRSSRRRFVPHHQS